MRPISINALCIVNFDFNILTSKIAKTKIITAQNFRENNAEFE
jgi:hypothetical protein